MNISIHLGPLNGRGTLPEASVVKFPRERLNRVNVVCMMMMESLTFELVFFPPACLNFRLMALSNELSEVTSRDPCFARGFPHES